MKKLSTGIIKSKYEWIPYNKNISKLRTILKTINFKLIKYIYIYIHF